MSNIAHILEMEKRIKDLEELVKILTGTAGRVKPRSLSVVLSEFNSRIEKREGEHVSLAARVTKLEKG